MPPAIPPEGPVGPAVERERDPDVHLGTAVAFAVSDAMGVPATDLAYVLYDYVDPDALEELFAPKDDGTPRSAGRVTFAVGDCEVTVVGGRRIVVTPLADPPTGARRGGAGDEPASA